MTNDITLENANAHFQKMVDLIANGQYDRAYQISEAILKVFPEADGVYHYQALLQNEAGEYALAYKLQLMALSYSPDNAQYHYAAAVYATSTQENLKAMMHYQRCLHISPHFHEALWNYSEHLRLNGNITMAIDCLHRLIALGKNDSHMFDNRLAACYAQIPAYKNQAGELYKKHIDDPNDQVAFWGYGLEELKHERFDTGFQRYNRRFERPDLNNSYSYDFPFPLWNGEFTHKQTVLLHGEQGLGDEMMFASTLCELIEEARQFNAKIIIACKAPLVRLFQYSFPETQVIAHAYNKPALDILDMPIDAQLPLGHLLKRNRRCMADFDRNRRPFFKADPARVAYYNERIKILGRESQDGQRRFRVGMMWGSASTENADHRVNITGQKSIPLSLFEPFIDLIDQVEFVSLQNHTQGHEVALLPELRMVDFRHDQADFLDTAAIIQNLDLVISICTSVSHLAGGLEAETWVPLIVDPDWRHGHQRSQSYWYNNTRYFHQQTRNHWYPTVLELYDALKNRIK